VSRKKTGPFFTFCNFCICTCDDTDRWHVYIRKFSTLSGVRLVSWILSWLIILCTSLSKQCFTKNDDSWLAVIYSVTASDLFFNLPDIIKTWSDPYIKTFSTLLGEDCGFEFYHSLGILCANAVKRHRAKITICHSCVTCFILYRSS